MNVSNIIKGCVFGASFCFSTVSYAWWDQGHQLITLLASKNISSETYKKADDLLHTPIEYPGSITLSENSSNFATVGSWADAINLYSNQPTEIPHKSCHYTDLEMDYSLSGTDITDDFAKKALQKSLLTHEITSISCLKSAIKTLTTASQTKKRKAIALRFLMHIVGDMTQPLHNITRVKNGEGDRGGNSFIFPSTIWIPSTSGYSSPQTKLHGVWDGSLGAFLQFPYDIKHIKIGEYEKSDLDLNQYYAKELMDSKWVQEIFSEYLESDESIENWVIDGYKLAAKYVYSDESARWGIYSGPRYDIVKTQIVKGSARLAFLLDAIFDPQNSALAFHDIVYTIKNDRKIKQFSL